MFSDGMYVLGYKINSDFYCEKCAREFCLFNLCSMLSEDEMTSLMPTKHLSTKILVKLLNNKRGDLYDKEIVPFDDFDFSESMNKIRYLSELNNLPLKQCANYHEFSHPLPFLINSAYR